MIRVVFFLLAVGVLALGIGWFADRPGEVAITWQGWRVETSLMVFAVAVGVLLVVLMLIWAIARGIVLTPRRLRGWRAHRRERQGYLAISRGLIAIGAGDAQAARRHAGEAARLAPAEPLTLLLGAQSAQLSGDRAAAEKTFRAMAGREDTKLIGLRGLFIEAQRGADAATAKLVAEEAAHDAPSLPWAGQAVLQLRSAAGDWAGALAFLERNRKHAAIDKADYVRKRAVLLTAQALSLEQSDRDTARGLILEAARLAPDFVPAATLAGRFLAEAGELRKATRVIRTAWRANPHPDLAATYAQVRFGDSALERLARARTLAEERPDHPESALAVARAALDAREFKAARDALAPLLAQPTRRVALLMADIERVEHGDEGAARAWMTRALHAARDPVWTADGIVSEQWLPMSPVSGRLDAFEWRVPVAELPAPGAPLAVPDAPLETAIDPDTVIEQAPAMPSADNARAAESAPEPAAVPVAPIQPVGGERAVAPVPQPAEMVIPVVNVPDDPGPEPEPEREPTPDAPPPGWRGFFR